MGREAGSVEVVGVSDGCDDRFHDSSTFMSVAWREGINSKILLDKIYEHFRHAYGMGVYETDELLNKHKQYDTFTLIDGKGYARYNIEGTVAYVMDCIVVDGGSGTLRKMCKLGQEKFPYAKTIRFERLLKKRKDMRHHTLKSFIKEVL